MPQIAIILLLVIVGTLLFVKWKNSKGIEKITYNLTHDEPAPKADTDELISTAQSADEALVERVEVNKAAIEQIEAATETIEEYRKPAEPVSVEEVKAETEEDASQTE